jgi:hypothetical protein
MECADDLAGRNATCPKCGHKMAIPAPPKTDGKIASSQDDRFDSNLDTLFDKLASWWLRIFLWSLLGGLAAIAIGALLLCVILPLLAKLILH